MIEHQTHIGLLVKKLPSRGVYGTRLCIRCLSSNMKRFISWNDAVRDDASSQAQTWLQSEHITVVGQIYNDATAQYTLLLDWNEVNQNLLGRVKLW